MDEFTDVNCRYEIAAWTGQSYNDQIGQSRMYVSNFLLENFIITRNDFASEVHKDASVSIRRLNGDVSSVDWAC